MKTVLKFVNKIEVLMVCGAQKQSLLVNRVKNPRAAAKPTEVVVV